MTWANHIDVLTQKKFTMFSDNVQNEVLDDREIKLLYRGYFYLVFNLY